MINGVILRASFNVRSKQHLVITTISLFNSTKRFLSLEYVYILIGLHVYGDNIGVRIHVFFTSRLYILHALKSKNFRIGVEECAHETQKNIKQLKKGSFLNIF